MEVINLANLMFKEHHIRVYGTRKDPLFIAEDVGAALGLTNVRATIRNYESYKKAHVNGVYTSIGRRNMTALTLPGLFALMLSSNMPAAKEFEKWLLTEVLPSICNDGYYNIQDTIDKQKQEQQHVPESNNMYNTTYEMPPPIQHNVGALVNKPIIIYHQYDLNDFRGMSCIYLIHIVDTDYKYGRSSLVNTRISTHMNEFSKCGYVPKLVKIWKCETAEIMNEVESMITGFAKWNKILVDPKKHKQCEVISTSDIVGLIAIIDKYIDRENSKCEKVTDIEKMKLEIAKIQAETAKMQVESKLHEQKMQLEPPRSIHRPLLPTRNMPLTITYSPPITNTYIASAVEQPSLHLTDTDDESTSEEQPIVNIQADTSVPQTAIPVTIPTIIQPMPIIPPPEPATQQPIPIVNTTQATVLKPPIQAKPINKKGKIQCECGEMIMPSNKTHITSKKHIKAIAQKSKR